MRRHRLSSGVLARAFVRGAELFAERDLRRAELLVVVAIRLGQKRDQRPLR